MTESNDLGPHTIILTATCPLCLNSTLECNCDDTLAPLKEQHNDRIK